VAAAERWLGQAAKAAPWDYQTNYTWLLCLKQQGKEAAAREVQEKVHRLETDGARFHELTEQLRQHPYDLSPRCEIARLFLSEGQEREGEGWLKAVLKIDPTYRLANQLLAEYYEKSGQPALALPYRRQADSVEGAGQSIPSPNQ
jgi:tetratricopeptide (TPR) repeat protein